MVAASRMFDGSGKWVPRLCAGKECGASCCQPVLLDRDAKNEGFLCGKLIRHGAVGVGGLHREWVGVWKPVTKLSIVI